MGNKVLWGHDYDAGKSNGAEADPALVDIYRGIKARDRFISLSLHVIPSTPKEDGGTKFCTFQSDI